MEGEVKIDVALSFASEDRAYVEMVAEQLSARDVSLFYDNYELAKLWGTNLYDYLIDVYLNQAQYTLMFVSKYYKEKIWTNHERRAAQSRALRERYEYILPARFDDTVLDGLLSTIAFIDLRSNSPVQVALWVCEKLGINTNSLKAYQVPSPKNPAMKAEASFDYSSYNGHFRIGEGQFQFDTYWAKCSNIAIYCRADSTNIRGVALVPHNTILRSIPTVDKLDFTSRVRRASVNQFVVLQNNHGIYAVLKILEIQDDTRNDPVDHLRFKYWILEDGSSNFSGLID